MEYKGILIATMFLYSIKYSRKPQKRNKSDITDTEGVWNFILLFMIEVKLYPEADLGLLQHRRWSAL